MKIEELCDIKNDRIFQTKCKNKQTKKNSNLTRWLDLCNKIEREINQRPEKDVCDINMTED